VSTTPDQRDDRAFSSRLRRAQQISRDLSAAIQTGEQTTCQTTNRFPIGSTSNTTCGMVISNAGASGEAQIVVAVGQGPDPVWSRRSP
jgi:hypothetical protein